MKLSKGLLNSTWFWVNNLWVLIVTQITFSLSGRFLNPRVEVNMDYLGIRSPFVARLQHFPATCLLVLHNVMSLPDPQHFASRGSS